MWIFHPLGGLGYQFWSGIGSDFGEILILSGLYMFWKRHNCHQDKCLRIGLHPYKHLILCKKHHPIEGQK